MSFTSNGSTDNEWDAAAMRDMREYVQSLEATIAAQAAEIERLRKACEETPRIVSNGLSARLRECANYRPSGGVAAHTISLPTETPQLLEDAATCIERLQKALDFAIEDGEYER